MRRMGEFCATSLMTAMVRLNKAARLALVSQVSLGRRGYNLDLYTEARTSMFPNCLG